MLGFPDINTHVRGEQKIKKIHRLKNEKYTIERESLVGFFPIILEIFAEKTSKFGSKGRP